ncbi:MAG: phosphatase PAP2 family protein [Gemmatimonadota bacterium]
MSRWRTACAAIGLLAPAPASLAGQAADSLTAPHRAPLVRSSDLLYAGTIVTTLSLVPALQGFEQDVSRGTEPAGSRDGFSQQFASAGAAAGDLFVDLGLSAATFLVGRAAHDPLTARVGRQAFEAVGTSVVLARILKLAVGRERPGVSMDANKFHPFSFGSEDDSYPSGHTAHLFAMAAVADRELRGKAPWVPFVAYPTAGLVGASRVVGQRHWITDVVAGAAVGLFSGQFVGRLHRAPDSRPGRDRARSRPGAAEASDRGPFAAPTVLPAPGGGVLLAVRLSLF